MGMKLSFNDFGSPASSQSDVLDSNLVVGLIHRVFKYVSETKRIQHRLKRAARTARPYASCARTVAVLFIKGWLSDAVVLRSEQIPEA